MKVRAFILLLLLLLLATGPAANAGLMFGIGGEESPPGISASDVVQVIGVDPVPANAALYIASYGDLSISGGSLVYGGNLSIYQDLEDYATAIGYADGPALLADFEAFGLTGIVDLSAATLADGSATPAPLTGVLIDGITTAGTGGQLDLLDETLSVMDTVITGIPEPMTLTLLGLGALLLRRRW